MRPISLHARTLLGALALGAVAPACKMGRAEVPEGATVAWSEMDASQRAHHMSAVVEPRMEAVFQGFDARRFADFGCETCHGAGAADGTYAMPSPDLPHLRERMFFREARKQHPEAARFMWKEVLPAMAESLGVTYGPKGALDCDGCHVVSHD